MPKTIEPVVVRSLFPSAIVNFVSTRWTQWKGSAKVTISLAAAMVAGIYSAAVGGGDLTEVAGVFLVTCAVFTGIRALWRRRYPAPEAEKV